MDSRWIGEFLKIWADRYKFRTEEKGSSLVIRPERIVVTSNYHPSELWPEQQTQILDPLYRRFKIIEIQALNKADDSIPKPKKTLKRLAKDLFPLSCNALKKPRLIPPPPPFKIVNGKVIKNVNPKIQRIIDDLWEEPDAQSMQIHIEDTDEDEGHVSHDSVVEIISQEEGRSDELSFSEASDEIL